MTTPPGGGYAGGRSKQNALFDRQQVGPGQEVEMITYRDYVADGRRRQEMMARAEQHRLLQSLRNEGAQGPNYFHRSLGQVGELLVALGQRMQTPGPGRKPTAITR